MNLITEDHFYRMTKRSRGMGIIIVNSFEQQGKEVKRKGAQSELENLIKLFDLMGLEPMIHTELKRKTIITTLQRFANDKRLNDHSMIAIAISSHGNELGIQGTDWQQVHPSQIQNIFSTKNCKQLANKPKLLLLNACRGSEVEDIIHVDGRDKREVIQADGVDIAPYKYDSIQDSDPDFFILHPSNPDHKAHRHIKHGSFFIQEILSTYTQLGETTPLELLMPIINRKVINDCEEHNTKRGAQCCNWTSSCSRILRIPPIRSVLKKECITAPVQPVLFPFDLIWANASRGSQGPNQMIHPCGLITSRTGEILITDPASSCVWKYSFDGEPVYELIGQEGCRPNNYIQLAITATGLENARSICISENYLYISCDTSIKRLPLAAGDPIDKQLDHLITGMDISEDGTIFACECETRNILLLDSNLNVLQDKLDLTHTLDRACYLLMDIKVLIETLYILVSNNEYSIQIFDKRGCHVQNLVSRGHLKDSCFFTINRTNRSIFAGDVSTNELKCFNEYGQLISRTGGYGEKRGEFSRPMGIDLNVNGEIIIVCADKSKFILQSFQQPFEYTLIST